MQIAYTEKNNFAKKLKKFN